MAEPLQGEQLSAVLRELQGHAPRPPMRDLAPEDLDGLEGCYVCAAPPAGARRVAVVFCRAGEPLAALVDLASMEASALPVVASARVFDGTVLHGDMDGRCVQLCEATKAKGRSLCAAGFSERASAVREMVDEQSRPQDLDEAELAARAGRVVFGGTRRGLRVRVRQAMQLRALDTLLRRCSPADGVVFVPEEGGALAERLVYRRCAQVRLDCDLEGRRLRTRDGQDAAQRLAPCPNFWLRAGALLRGGPTLECRAHRGAEGPPTLVPLALGAGPADSGAELQEALARLRVREQDLVALTREDRCGASSGAPPG